MKLLFFAVIAFSSFVIGCKSNSDEQKESFDNLIIKKKQEALLRLDSTKFEILEEEILPQVSNYYILYKGSVGQDSITDFVLRFRDVHCRPSNIYMYDTKRIYPLCKKYPLEGNEYVQVADHFIGESSFDNPNEIYWYPFQDILYKKYGGKNWKKEPIK